MARWWWSGAGAHLVPVEGRYKEHLSRCQDTVLHLCHALMAVLVRTMMRQYSDAKVMVLFGVMLNG